MKVNDIIERIGHILISNPTLLEKNDEILKKYDIDFRKCIVGPGIDVLAYFDLEKRMKTILEMCKMDEVQNNKEEALEIIRGCFMKLNFKEVKDKTYKKGSSGLC